MITISDKEFNRLVNFVKYNFGIILKNKRSLIESRLSNVISEKGFNNYTDYLENVYSDRTGGEINILIDKLTTNHTFFMREPVHFDFYRERILPEIKLKAKDHDLRVWSAGCSSGEEPYTIAMTNHDFFGNQIQLWDTSVLATDISSKVLNFAKRGVYDKEDLDDIKPVWKKRYFNRINENEFEVCNKIKSDVIFRNFNLMEEIFPFKKKFHVIFCRNVMIYFDNATRCELINKFYECIEPGGYLFIGHSESVNREKSEFKYVMPAIYHKE